MLRRIVFTLLLTFPFPTAFSQITMHDDLGREVVLAGPATRVVSLAPSITETICAVGACDNLIGVTDYCNVPAEVRTKAHVGGLINPSIEAIVNLRPDLVVVTPEGNVKESFSQLERVGTTVFVSNPRSVAGIYKSIRDIGQLTGREESADSLVRSMMERADRLRGSADHRPRVLLAVALQPLIVVGRGTFLAEMIDLAGGDNIARESELTYPPWSREQVLASDPEVIILTSGLVKDSSQLLELFPEWKAISALSTGAVCSIDADLLSRPGPRIIEGMEAIHDCIIRK